MCFNILKLDRDFCTSATKKAYSSWFSESYDEHKNMRIETNKVFVKTEKYRLYFLKINVNALFLKVYVLTSGVT